MDNCVFCKIIKRELPAFIIDENDDVIALVTPENHPLVITKKHIENIYTLDDKTASAVMIEAVKIANAVKKGLHCDGVNLVQSNDSQAGQDIFHFHLHIKPRWKHDKVDLTWKHEVKPEDTRKETMEIIKKALNHNQNK